MGSIQAREVETIEIDDTVKASIRQAIEDKNVEFFDDTMMRSIREYGFDKIRYDVPGIRHISCDMKWVSMLALSVRKMCDELTKLFISYGMSVNDYYYLDQCGQLRKNPLFFDVISFGSTEIAQLFISEGFDVNLMFEDYRDKDGRCYQEPLFYHAIGVSQLQTSVPPVNYVDNCRMFLEAGVNLNLRNHDSGNVLLALVKEDWTNHRKYRQELAQLIMDHGGATIVQRKAPNRTSVESYLQELYNARVLHVNSSDETFMEDYRAKMRVFGDAVQLF